MTRVLAVAAAITAPSMGPSILILFGMQLPIAALGLSLVGLMLARYVKPRQGSNLTIGQERALTCLLALILVVIVSGELSACTIRATLSILGDGPECRAEPLGVGMATAWGVGLGTSGIIAVDFIGGRIMRALKVLLDGEGKRKG